MWVKLKLCLFLTLVWAYLPQQNPKNLSIMGDSLLNMGFGVLFVFIGPYMFLHYQKIRKENKGTDFHAKYMIYGIVTFIIGVILIMRGIIQISLD